MLIVSIANLRRSYSPQSPAALSNGTTTIEAQVETVVDMIAKLEADGAKSIEAQREAEIAWKESLEAVANMTLVPQTSSWWNGSNIPGKKAEAMNYMMGMLMWP